MVYDTHDFMACANGRYQATFPTRLGLGMRLWYNVFPGLCLPFCCTVKFQKHGYCGWRPSNGFICYGIEPSQLKISFVTVTIP